LAVRRKAAVSRNPLAQRVQRANIHVRQIEVFARAFRHQCQQPAQPFFELPGRFFRKRGQENVLRFDLVMDEQMDRAPEQHAGLSRPRTSSDEEWEAKERDRVLSLFVRLKI
jgi:hypothetical protein